jgi:thiamine pyrophosphate-dependent acetolactate synthase large subunit-like protein
MGLVESFGQPHCDLLIASRGRPIATRFSMRFRVLAILIATCGLATAQRSASAGGSPEHRSDVEITWHIFKPRFMQGVDTVKLMEPVAALNVQITNPAHASIVVNRACRTPLGNRCVAHVTIPKDPQAMKLSDDTPSMENHGLRTSESWSPVESAPDTQQLQAAASILKSGKRVAILAGQGALAAGMLATMAPGLPFAIAAQFAYPNRQSVAVVGDGGFAMLMAELTTAVQHNLAVTIVVLKNNSLSEVRFQQQELGNPPYECDLGPIDFVGFAKACGADGFRCATPAEVRPALTSALRSPKAAIVEAVVDPDEPTAKPEEVRA